MSGLITDPARQALMRRVRRRGTSTEKAVALVCRKLRLSYRLNVKSLPGSPDIANKAKRWAIFVNGCYWHHHTNCPLGSSPIRNRDFWREKFASNRSRDARKIRQLRVAGYRVVVVWQCKAKDNEVLVRRLSKLCEPRFVNSP